LAVQFQKAISRAARMISDGGQKQHECERCPFHRFLVDVEMGGTLLGSEWCILPRELHLKMRPRSHESNNSGFPACLPSQLQNPTI
jgi:hypothetical protein